MNSKDNHLLLHKKQNIISVCHFLLILPLQVPSVIVLPEGQVHSISPRVSMQDPPVQSLIDVAQAVASSVS